MALSQATLATELENMSPSSSESLAIEAFSQAYGDYMKTAIAGAVPIIGAAIDSIAVPAMRAAIDWDPGDSCLEGTTEMVEGLAAFWASMVAAPASFFADAIAISPPSFAGLATTLHVTLCDNQDAGKTLAESAAEMAQDIHPSTDEQGTATFPGPIVETIT